MSAVARRASGIAYCVTAISLMDPAELLCHYLSRRVILDGEVGAGFE